MKTQHALTTTQPDDAGEIDRGRRLAAHCARYRQAKTGSAVFQLVTTLIPFFVLAALMTYLVPHALWATLLLSVPAAGLLVRLFIMQHDCGHGSFFHHATPTPSPGGCSAF